MKMLLCDFQPQLSCLFGQTCWLRTCTLVTGREVMDAPEELPGWVMAYISQELERWKHNLPGAETEGVKRSREEEGWTTHRAVSFAVKPNKHNAGRIVHFYVLLAFCIAWAVFEWNIFHFLTLGFSFVKRTPSIPVNFTSDWFAETYGRKWKNFNDSFLYLKHSNLCQVIDWSG